MEKQGNSSTRAKDRYNSKNYDEIKFRGKKGDRERIDKAAENYESRNAFIMAAIEEKIERDKLNDGEV